MFYLFYFIIIMLYYIAGILITITIMKTVYEINQCLRKKYLKINIKIIILFMTFFLYGVVFS